MRYGILLFLLLSFSGPAQSVYSQECPRVVVSCPNWNSDPRLVFSANVSGVDQSSKLTYKWTVSNGKLISGQGTPSIIVDTNNEGGISFTATVEVNGFPAECSNQASCAINVCHLPVSRKFDEYRPDDELNSTPRRKRQKIRTTSKWVR